MRSGILVLCTRLVLVGLAVACFAGAEAGVPSREKDALTSLFGKEKSAKLIANLESAYRNRKNGSFDLVATLCANDACTPAEKAFLAKKKLGRGLSDGKELQFYAPLLVALKSLKPKAPKVKEWQDKDDEDASAADATPSKGAKRRQRKAAKKAASLGAEVTAASAESRAGEWDGVDAETREALVNKLEQLGKGRTGVTGEACLQSWYHAFAEAKGKGPQHLVNSEDLFGALLDCLDGGEGVDSDVADLLEVIEDSDRTTEQGFVAFADGLIASVKEQME